MEYNVVFDVAESGYRQWCFPAFGLIFVAAAFRAPIRTPGLRRGFYIVFAALWTILAFGGTLADYLNLSADLRNGRCSVVEGVVSEYRQLPPGPETFVVAGQRFKYSDHVLTAGFNHTQSHGGPMREGLRVRIHYAGNEIARLEIAR
jgi:hypothetical protein